MSDETTTKTKLKLSKEARELLTHELGFLGDVVAPEINTALAGFLDLLGPKPQDAAPAKGQERASDIAQRATTAAGSAAGFSDADLTPVLDFLEGLEPDMLQGFIGLAQQLAGGTTSLVDPRFASFLAPGQRSSTSGSGLDQAAQIGSLVSSIVGAGASAAAVGG